MVIPQFLPLAARALSDLAPHLLMRETLDQDRVFVDALYVDSREDLRALGVDPALLGPLLQMQQRVQQAGFSANFPGAQHWLVQNGGKPIGRLVVDAGPRDVRVVDIAISSTARRMGAARAVLRALQTVAQAQQLGISLAASKTNPAAQALYRGLGFSVATHDEMFDQLVWKPAA